jgi:hypothetical protein
MVHCPPKTTPSIITLILVSRLIPFVENENADGIRGFTRCLKRLQVALSESGVPRPSRAGNFAGDTIPSAFRFATAPRSPDLLFMQRLGLFTFLKLLVLLCFAPAWFGCAKPALPQRVVRVAVLDGLATYPADPGGNVKQEGWWLGSQDRYLSSTTGIEVAEALARGMARLPGVAVQSRDDQRIYMAEKERRLSRAYPSLKSTERKRLLLEQNPIDYGRDLNVDFVIRPEVLKASTVTNRTFSWWWSDMEVIVEVWRVSPAEKVSTLTFRKKEFFASQVALANRVAKSTTTAVRRTNMFGVETPLTVPPADAEPAP